MTTPEPRLKRWLTLKNMIGVILILLAIFVYQYFGIVDNGDIPEFCTLTEELYCKDFHITPKGVGLVVKNNGQSTIEVTEMRVKEIMPTTLMECEFDSFTLAPSETRTIQSSLCPTDIYVSSGHKYKFDITYVYSLEGDSTKHTGTGEMFAKVK